MSESPRIIYITSRGHSGSTLLDLLISSHSQVVSVGELKMLSRHFDDPCTCGADNLASCPFWIKVDQRLQAAGYPELKALDVGSTGPQPFHDHNRALYETVAEVSGCDVVVDSSKNLDRLQSLLDFTSFDVCVIHLTRDPFGVVWSNLKRGRDWRYHARNYSFAMARTLKYLRNHQHLVVRYEDMVTDTEATMRRVMEHAGLEFELTQLEWAQRKGHNIYGNEMRFTASSDIRPDISWQKSLTIVQKLMIRWMTYPARKGSPELYDRFRDMWELRDPAAVAGSVVAGLLPAKWGIKLRKWLNQRRKTFA